MKILENTKRTMGRLIAAVALGTVVVASVPAQAMSGSASDFSNPVNSAGGLQSISENQIRQTQAESFARGNLGRGIGGSKIGHRSSDGSNFRATKNRDHDRLTQYNDSKEDYLYDSPKDYYRYDNGHKFRGSFQSGRYFGRGGRLGFLNDDNL